MARVHKENIEISYIAQEEDDDDDINEIIIDINRVNQILMRLIDNAIKFTHSGNITIGHKLLHSKIIFFVKDSGIGIPKEKQRIIFDPFRQVDESYSKNHAGTGLGLAICKGLINQMNGSIWIESSPDNGTGFYFSTPYKANH